MTVKYSSRKSERIFLNTRERDMPMCLICDVIERIKNGTNPYFVRELETGYLVIGFKQYFYGYSLFLCKQHVTELFYLDDEFCAKFQREMVIAAEAVKNAFSADKMNYELLGNGDVHLHWHLYPRRKGDLETDGIDYGTKGAGPVWWVPWDIMNDDKYLVIGDELELMKAKLNTALDEALKKHNC